MSQVIKSIFTETLSHDQMQINYKCNKLNQLINVHKAYFYSQHKLDMRSTVITDKVDVAADEAAVCTTCDVTTLPFKG